MNLRIVVLLRRDRAALRLISINVMRGSSVTSLTRDLSGGCDRRLGRINPASECPRRTEPCSDASLLAECYKRGGGHAGTDCFGELVAGHYSAPCVFRVAFRL